VHTRLLPPAVLALPTVDAYYAGSSSSLSIPNVRVPLLVVQVRPPLPLSAASAAHAHHACLDAQAVGSEGAAHCVAVPVSAHPLAF
jgi:hypothetical protein